MNILSRLIRKLYVATIGKLITRREKSRLQSEDDEVLKSLANVLDAVMQNRYSYEEKDWIEKIETLRNNLNTSSIRISITDYGAGSQDLNLTAEEMSQGRVVVRTIGEVCQSASKPYKWDFLLFKLVRVFRPSVCLELGTALGISAAYQAAACELNRHGRIVTLDGAESLVSLARENFERLGIERGDVVLGRFQDTLQDVLDENAPIDFVFIDGHHDENATLTYFRQILPHLSDGAILIFDDISWSRGMERAWNTIQKDRNLKVSVDLFSVGVCFFTKSTVEKKKYFKIAI
ncbi:MAG: O-methyltransferase [bacterium]